MIELHPAGPDDVADLVDFLSTADLTLSGVESPTVRLWIARSPTDGRVCASTGFERSDNGTHVLIRSVAVAHDVRSQGLGLTLARFALDEARKAGAEHAWLFSRRSGPFWEKLGFSPADKYELATLLASTHQVQLFTESGQLDREVAWSRPL